MHPRCYVRHVTATTTPGDHSRLGLPDGILACLFDLDGVLTDTARVHRAAWKQTFDDILTAHGQPESTDDDYVRHVDGKPRLAGVRDFLDSRGIHQAEGRPDDGPDADTVVGIGNRKNALFGEHLATDGADVYPGSASYLEAVRGAGLRIAVVTSSANGEAVLAQAGLAGFVEARVDGVTARNEGLAGKPAPDTFLACAERLGVAPDRIVVFEDAVSGVAAGRAGGFALVIGVDRHAQADLLREHGADRVVGDLSELLADPEVGA